VRVAEPSPAPGHLLPEAKRFDQAVYRSRAVKTLNAATSRALHNWRLHAPLTWKLPDAYWN